MIFDVTMPAMRIARAQTFRKRLGVFNYKVRTHWSHKKPGVMPFNIKQNLIKQDTHHARLVIKKMEENSHYPFGQFTRKGKFMFNPEKVPLYNVPDLTGFQLKPYVSVHTPQIDDDIRSRLANINDFSNPENFGRFNKNVPATGKEEIKA